MLHFSGMVVPFLLAFGAGLFLRFDKDAMRSRAYWRLGLSVAVACLLYFVLKITVSDDPRIPSMSPCLLLGSVLGFLTMPSLEYLFPRSVVLLVSGALAVLLSLGQLSSLTSGMHPLENHVAVSPDGRYTARLIYFDGLTCGYYFVCVKSNSPAAHWQGADEVAEAAAEGFDSIEWSSKDTLVVRYEPDAEFVKKTIKWQDVKIKYEKQVTSPHS